MKKIIIAIAFGVLGATAYAGSSTYSGTVTVKAPTGEGKVYVTNDANKTPSADEYAESASQALSFNYVGTSKLSKMTGTAFLWATPADGKAFKYWEDASGNVVTNPVVNVSLSTSGTSHTYNAVFGEPSALTVRPNDPSLGTATIDKIDNAVGDEVTITAALAESWAGGMGVKRTSKSLSFDGWYDASGNLVSHDAKLTLTIEKPLQLTARFNWDEHVLGEGYYHVRWSYAEKFWKLSGAYNPVTGPSASSRKMSGVLDLTTVNDYSDPASVMKVSGTFTPVADRRYGAGITVIKDFVMEAQGESTASVLNDKTLDLVTAHNTGFYKVLNGDYTIFVTQHTTSSNSGSISLTADKTGDTDNDPDTYLEFEPLTEEYLDRYFFGAAPAEEMYYDGGYWTSMYTSFPYECRDGVEAYYISSLYEGNDETIAAITHIEDGIVPAYSAVLLKCQGLTARENRLLPLMEEYAPIEDNLLNGEFQLNTSANTVKKGFDGSIMRVFGENEGEVGFYRLEEGTELAANRVWLNISSLSQQALQAGRRIVIRNDHSGVENVAADATETLSDGKKYDLYGREIQHPASGTIYIQDGRKYIAR